MRVMRHSTAWLRAPGLLLLLFWIAGSGSWTSLVSAAPTPEAGAAATTLEATSSDASLNADALEPEPVDPQQGAASEDPAPLPATPQVVPVFTRAALAEARAAWEESGAGGPEQEFRLFSSRRIEYRLRPLGALRVPALAPVFSPVAPHFMGEDPAGTRFALRASLSLFSVDGERQSAKFQEFRELDDGAVLGIDGQYRSPDAFFHVVGRHLFQDDGDLWLRGGHTGKYRAEIFYNQILHNFAFDARSLYSGVGTGELTIADSIQQNLQSSTSPMDAARRAQDALSASGQNVDLSLIRDRISFDFDLLATEPVLVELKAFHESRQGARPWSGSFGFSNFVEIPWPVDYDTDQGSLSVEYAKNYVFVNASFYSSSFENNIDAVRFDNPWRASDNDLGFSIFTSFLSGPASGLIDLYPSNDAQNFSLTGAVTRLPGHSTFSGSVSMGTMEQDDPLLPFTTNTALVPGAPSQPPFDASDPANLPVSQAKAEIDTELIQLRFTSRPSSHVRIKAHFRRYGIDNQTEQIFLPGFVLEDGQWRTQETLGATFSNLPIDFTKTTSGVDLAFRLAPSTQLTVGYTLEEVERDFREVEETDEDRIKISLDTKAASWLELRASYEASERDGTEYDFAQWQRNQGNEFIPVLPTLFKYDQANRDRDRLQVLATFTPTQNLVVASTFIFGEDDFPDSAFGLKEDEHRVYSADLSYLVGERWSLYASYSFEKYESLQSARAWIPFGPGDPFRVETGVDSPSNWDAESEDQGNTLGFGLQGKLIGDRLRFDLAVTLSETDGEIRYSSPESPLGGPVDLTPNAAPFPEVDDVEFYSLNPELEYLVNDRLSFILGYFRERYDIDDFNYPGFTLVPTRSDGAFNGAILMGTLFPSYNTEAIYAKLNWGLRQPKRSQP